MSGRDAAPLTLAGRELTRDETDALLALIDRRLAEDLLDGGRGQFARAVKREISSSADRRQGE